MQKNLWNKYLFLAKEKWDEITHRTKMEIKFQIIQNRKIPPLEVKFDNKITAKFLNKFKDTFKNRENNGIILYDGNLKNLDDYLYLPLYMIDYLK